MRQSVGAQIHEFLLCGRLVALRYEERCRLRHGDALDKSLPQELGAIVLLSHRLPLLCCESIIWLLFSRCLRELNLDKPLWRCATTTLAKEVRQAERAHPPLRAVCTNIFEQLLAALKACICTTEVITKAERKLSLCSTANAIVGEELLAALEAKAAALKAHILAHEALAKVERQLPHLVAPRADVDEQIPVFAFAIRRRWCLAVKTCILAHEVAPQIKR
mmetsp:Transcript_407/g.773  ORF Transcript_407/g.773 Transcript_407/m.773 type:complete len:220 (+) Transcript_407:283-942(+)